MPQLQIYLPDDSRITHDLTEEKVTIGRLSDNTLQVDDGSISSNHAEIVFEDEQYHLHDLGSTNGTFVNGEQVTDAVLRHGDEVRFGTIGAVFISEETGGASQPLPESSAVTAELAARSSRPANFVCSSPIPKNVAQKDPIAMGILGLAGLSTVVFLAAAFLILTMQAPS